MSYFVFNIVPNIENLLVVFSLSSAVLSFNQFRKVPIRTNVLPSTTVYLLECPPLSTAQSCKLPRLKFNQRLAGVLG